MLLPLFKLIKAELDISNTTTHNDSNIDLRPEKFACVDPFLYADVEAWCPACLFIPNVTRENQVFMSI